MRALGKVAKNSSFTGAENRAADETPARSATGRSRVGFVEDLDERLAMASPSP